MREYAFSMIMFLLAFVFVNFPVLSAAVLGLMSLSLASLSFMAVRSFKKAPVYVESVHIKSWDSWT